MPPKCKRVKSLLYISLAMVFVLLLKDEIIGQQYQKHRDTANSRNTIQISYQMIFGIPESFSKDIRTVHTANLTDTLSLKRRTDSQYTVSYDTAHTPSKYSGTEPTRGNSQYERHGKSVNGTRYLQILRNDTRKPHSRKRRAVCPDTVQGLDLQGEINLNLTTPKISELEAKHMDVDGGSWRPHDCIPRHNVAIILPYRDRLPQLLLLLQHLHPYLQKQQIAYTIYVFEQVSGKVFNRGLVRNIGFLVSQRLNRYHQCTIFHDVDLLPLDERNLYTCPEQPRHMCAAVNYLMDYRPLYVDKWAIFGGVTAFKNQHFRQVNGYSNIYIGWGAEDDDMYKRIKYNNLEVIRYPDHIASYYGIPHVDEGLLPRPASLAQNASRFKLMNIAERRISNDGINTAQYHIISISKQKLFTHVLFDVEENKYAQMALKVDREYDELYGSLTEAWSELDFIPRPYWWRDPTQAARVRTQRAQKVAEKYWWQFWR